MGWQLPADHIEALKHPLRCFQDADLKRGQVVQGSTGNPLARSGRQGQVYQVRGLVNLQRFAVKIYREETLGLDRHYRALAEHLLQVDSPYLVPFQYSERGACVRGRWYPAVKMQWVDGQPLNAFVAEAADKPQVLQQLALLWLRVLPELRRLGVAHRCLEHDHILVAPGADRGPPTLKLVDYDGMYVPALEGSQPLESGHANYQHPRRLWQQTYDAESDRFAHLVIYTALVAVAAGGRALWERYDSGDNLLFKESDFQEPGTSALLRELWRRRDPVLRALVGHVLLAAQGSGREVPLLERLAADAQKIVGGKPVGLPLFVLSDEQERKVNQLLRGDAEDVPVRVVAAAAPRAGRTRNTFGILVDEDGTEARPSRARARPADDNFDLIVDSDPDLNLPPAPKPAPPPLPAMPPPLPVAPAMSFLDDPHLRTYRLEAWMPEQVAVMKVQGFVDAATGEVLASEPGLMRVQLLDPYEAVNRPRPGLLAWLGFTNEPPPQGRVLAVLDFEMKHKETAHKKLLDITLRIRPGTEAPEPTRWRAYCDKLFCDVRAFLMGLQ